MIKQIFKLLTCLLILTLVNASNSKGPYETLGLKRRTSLDQVKKAFRKLSLQYHPDKNSDPRVEGKYKEITDAYQTIIDGKADQYYDQQLNGHGNGNAYSSYSSYQSGQTTYTYYSSGGGRYQQSDQSRQNEYNRQFEDAFQRNHRRNAHQHQQQRTQTYSSISSFLMSVIYEALKDPFVLQIILVCMLFGLLQMAFSIVAGDVKQKVKANNQSYHPPTQSHPYSQTQYSSTQTPDGQYR